MKENNIDIGNNYAYPLGDQLKITFDDPDYKEAGLFVSKLYREKLLNPDVLTRTADQLKAMVNNGKIAVAVSVDMAVIDAGNMALKSKDSNDGYQYIWPIHKDGISKDKVKISSYNSIGWNVNVITTKAKDPEGIFRFMDWEISEEGSRVAFYGPKGVYYDSVDDKGNPITNDKYLNATPEEKKAALGESYLMAGNTTIVDTMKTSIEMKLPEAKRNFTTVAQQTYTFKTSSNASEFFDITPAGNSDEGLIAAKLLDLDLQTRAKLTLAKTDDDVTKALETASKDAKTLGIEKVLKFYTAKWEDNKKKMGIK